MDAPLGWFSRRPPSSPSGTPPGEAVRWGPYDGTLSDQMQMRRWGRAEAKPMSRDLTAPGHYDVILAEAAAAGPLD